MGLVWRSRTSLVGQLIGLVRLVASFAAQLFYRPSDAVAEEYHKWYYGNLVWTKTTYMGINCWKSVSDMWNYQEILSELQPSLVIEFGTRYGGSAVYFANIMRQIGQPFKVLTVDNSHKALDPRARREPDVLFVESSSTDPAIAEQIQRLKNEYPGKIFAILDSDHSMNHVLAEMKLLRPLLSAGDYLVVEDSNINGHPVLPGFGPGPYEAIEAYEDEFPNDYKHDAERGEQIRLDFRAQRISDPQLAVGVRNSSTHCILGDCIFGRLPAGTGCLEIRGRVWRKQASPATRDRTLGRARRPTPHRSLSLAGNGSCL